MVKSYKNTDIDSHLQQFIKMHFVEKESNEYYDKLNLDESLRRLKIQARLRQQRTLTINRFKIGKQPFIVLLQKYCRNKKANPLDIFTKAHIDETIQQKIENDIDYIPALDIIFKLIIVLKLTEFEAKNLLEECQLYFRMWEYLDVVILFCLRKKIYENQVIDEFLNIYDVYPLFS